MELGLRLGLRLGSIGSEGEPEPGTSAARLSGSRNRGGAAEPPCPAESDGDPSMRLSLLPLAPVGGGALPEFGHQWGSIEASIRGLDVNRTPSVSAAEADEQDEMATTSASPNGGGGGSERMLRVSDDEDGASARKKLRLSKEQSAFLEESFKEHSTLTPKQKNALARQLNLRPRQVEVWFQNRRARTKLKQTEVDCEYLKRCCEALTAENRRLQKELADLRALKTAAHPFFARLPATTLSICPSCERLATSSASPAAPSTAAPDASANHPRPSPLAALFASASPPPASS